MNSWYSIAFRRCIFRLKLYVLGVNRQRSAVALFYDTQNSTCKFMRIGKVCRMRFLCIATFALYINKTYRKARGLNVCYLPTNAFQIAIARRHVVSAVSLFFLIFCDKYLGIKGAYDYYIVGIFCFL